MKEEDILLKKLGKENSFKVPEGYFENFTSEVMKKLPEKEALELCYHAINDGAAGVDMGRNVFQSESPAAMIQAVHAVVHDGLTPEQGFEMFQDLSK